MFAGKTYWIVGASEGLGRALAVELAQAGAMVIASARNAARLDELCAETANITALPCDVTDTDAVARAAARASGADALIYCAGAYDPVSATNWAADSVIKMAEVNYLGALRVLGVALPNLLARKHGHIVLIGSLAGFRGLPGAIGYGSSKAALMHLAENLRADLAGNAIKVQCINPGFIETRLTAKNAFSMPQIMTAQTAAKQAIKAMEKGRFSTSFPAPFSWLFTFGRFLPLRIFQGFFQTKP